MEYKLFTNRTNFTSENLNVINLEGSKYFNVCFKTKKILLTVTNVESESNVTKTFNCIYFSFWVPQRVI